MQLNLAVMLGSFFMKRMVNESLTVYNEIIMTFI